MEDIRFDERYDDNYSGETTLFFIAPTSLLDNFSPKGEYADAVGTEIAIEVPTNNIEAKNPELIVSISPIIETENGYEYDWTDIDIPNEEIETLLVIAMEANAG